MLHRLAELQRLEGSLDVSSPTPLPKQGQVDQVAQGHVPLGFEYLQGWRLHSLSVQPVSVFDHPHSKKDFSYI